MLARSNLPSLYCDWNRKWGAPAGSRFYRSARMVRGGRRVLLRFPRLCGPFVYQENSLTRRYEYPWAYYATRLPSGLRVCEVGGGLAGFQFVLARQRLEVINVDPGENAHGVGWPIDGRSIERLNRSFRTSVRLEKTFLEDARFEDDSFDRVFSISTIEHIPVKELPGLIVEIYRILKPGGFFVATIDLFLNLVPFTERESNRYGRNIDIRWLIAQSGFRLVSGERSELCGFPEFEPKAILAHLEDFLVGTYPGLSQLLVLEKPV